MTWDDIAKSYANLGWVGEGEGVLDRKIGKAKSTTEARRHGESKDRNIASRIGNPSLDAEKSQDRNESC